jgi:hypothetical protein
MWASLLNNDTSRDHEHLPFPRFSVRICHSILGVVGLLGTALHLTLLYLHHYCIHLQQMSTFRNLSIVAEHDSQVVEPIFRKLSTRVPSD